jgi:hypothetical protein
MSLETLALAALVAGGIAFLIWVNLWYWRLPRDERKQYFARWDSFW